MSGPAPFSWRIDTMAPVVTLGSGPTGNSADATFAFASDDPGATFECQLLPSIGAFAPCASPKTFAAQTDGDHTFNVRATDVAGNMSDTLSSSLRIDTGPRL